MLCGTVVPVEVQDSACIGGTVVPVELRRPATAVKFELITEIEFDAQAMNAKYA